MTVKRSDVVIVGAGIAGLVLAYECLEKGFSVQVLEWGSDAELGGLARLAFGGMALVDTPLQRRFGIRDSAELAMGDWESLAEFSETDMWPRRWAEHYVSEACPRVYHWLHDHGLRFFPAVNWVERGLDRRGNSVPRYHVLWGTGHGLVERFRELLEQHPNSGNLCITFNTRVDDLIVSDGRVTGCTAVETGTGKCREYLGDHVVIATGGINGNLQKVREHWPGAPAEMLNGAQPNANGHMHDRVTAYGGNVTHLDKLWNYAAGIPHPQPLFENHGLSLIPCKSALWLDHTGDRIGPEPLVTGFDTYDLCQRVASLEKPWTWQLLNWRIAAKEFAISGSEHNPHLRDHRLFAFLKETLLGNHRLVTQMAEESDHFVVAPDLETLVAKMNALNPQDPVQFSRIHQSVADYDDVIRRGKAHWNDEQLRRIEHTRGWRSDRVRTCKPKPILDSPPLIAIKLRLITRKSLGGIQTDLASRVLGKNDKPLPGLYAIGEAAGFGGGGANGKRSLEGTFLSACILTARAAADTIAAGG